MAGQARLFPVLIHALHLVLENAARDETAENIDDIAQAQSLMAANRQQEAGK